MKRLLALVVCIAFGSGSAVAVGARADREPLLRPLSGSSPFKNSDGSMPECARDLNDPLWGPIPDYEYEATISTNPHDPDHLAAVWLADDSIAVGHAASFDGGITWQTGIVPGITKCTGGEYRNVMDARVAIAPSGPEHPHGIVYVAALPMAQPCPDPRCDASRIVVTKSVDGGLTFAQTLTLDEVDVDFPIVAVDPSSTLRAYVSWSEITDAGLRVLITKTADGGDSWSPPTVMRESPGRIGGAQIFVGDDRTLWAVYQDMSLQELQTARLLGQKPPGMSVRVLRSTDRGASWDETSFQAFSSDIWPVGAAAAPDGSLYVAWPRSSDHGTSLVASKSVGIDSWSEPKEISNNASLAAIAVLPSGSLGVMYLDHRRDIRTDEELTTDIWLSYLDDADRAWSEVHIAGPFDTTPSKIPFYGDHLGLTAFGCSFGGVFPLAAPYEVEGKTDVYFSRTNLPPRACQPRSVR